MAAVERSIEQVRAFWDEMADFYTQTSAPLTAKVYRAMLPFVRVQEATTVVEAACGSGNGIDILLSVLPPTARILANDISPKFLEIVRAKGQDRVEAVEADNESLPYGDACAERYIANMSLHSVLHPDRMAAEAFRVLRPGGIAGFSVWGERCEATYFDLQQTLQERFGAVSGHSPFHLHSPQDLRHLLKAAGFARVVTFCEYCYLPLADLRQLEDTFMRNPEIKAVYGPLDEDKKAQFLELLRSRLHEIIVIQQHPLAIHTNIAIAFKE